jgi:RimJ/RimL family protein N-acetyltransferase
MMTCLHPMTDADYGWLLGERLDHPAQLRLPEAAISPPEVVSMLRGVTAGIASTEPRPVAWLASEDGALVAMISFTKRGADGRYELGYGVSPAHRGQGVMTRALAALLPLLAADGHHGLTVETSVDNPASQRVLERNGFARTGTRDDPEDGALITWAIDLKDKAET